MTRLAIAITIVLLLVPAEALASEVDVVAAGGQVSVEPGSSASLKLEVSASRDISCAADQAHPAFATLRDGYTLSAGGVTPGAPGSPLAFYRDESTPPHPAGGCEPDWDTAPKPYLVTVPVSAAPGTPEGLYDIVVTAAISGTARSLADTVPLAVQVEVESDAPPPPFSPEPTPLAALVPPPIENKTVNLVPVRGTVLIKVPKEAGRHQITDPVQVPDGTRVNAKNGYVEVISDSTGRGDGSVQAATFWNDSFRVGYTRALTPGRRRRARLPITELVVTSRCVKGARASTAGERSEIVSTARKRKRRRGLFGRGKGRFRTRGSYGAGTVRGTSWYTENRCNGTLFEVFRGVVSVRDFGLGRSVSVPRGEGYLAAPHDKSEGDSSG